MFPIIVCMVYGVRFQFMGASAPVPRTIYRLCSASSQELFIKVKGEKLYFCSGSGGEFRLILGQGFSPLLIYFCACCACRAVMACALLCLVLVSLAAVSAQAGGRRDALRQLQQVTRQCTPGSRRKLNLNRLYLITIV